MRYAAKRFYLAVFSLLGACHAQSSGAGANSAIPESCAIDPEAIVSDACASFSTLDSLNTELQPTIQSLTKDSDFFSYYRLNLYDTTCPFWSDENGLCGNIACAVNTIENEEDIPQTWRAEELGKLEGPKAHHPNRQLQREAKPLMGELGADVGESCVVEYDDECDERDYCIPEDESATAKGDYVSLVDNPERFTGYSGPSAHQVWEAIYRENCFPKEQSSPESPLQASSNTGFSGLQHEAAQDLRNVMVEQGRHQILASGTQDAQLDDDLDSEDQCLEKRTFYRIISGMHASISTHLCYDYLNQSTGQWGPNLQCYTSRLHEYPDRISNLYFNYALVLRAVSKLKPTLSGYTYCSGDPSQDALTKQKINTLADQIASAPQIYDESLMFRDPGLKEDFRNRFRNVSRTMDCVGCDKCRLWGKLQTAGYGTALKILFEFDEKDGSDNPPLRRTELVALINTLDKISHSLSAIAKFQSMLAGGDSVPSPPDGSVTGGQPANPEHYNNADKRSNLDEEASLFEDDNGSSTDWPEQTFMESLTEEITLFVNMGQWVLRSWLGLPANLWKLFVILVSRMWDFWLGRPSPEWNWTTSTPPTRDEF